MIRVTKRKRKKVRKIRKAKIKKKSHSSSSGRKSPPSHHDSDPDSDGGGGGGGGGGGSGCSSHGRRRGRSSRKKGLGDTRVGNIVIEQCPGKGKPKRYFQQMCNAVSAASGNPKKAWLLMLDFLEKTYEELAEEDGMDTL